MTNKIKYNIKEMWWEGKDFYIKTTDDRIIKFINAWVESISDPEYEGVDVTIEELGMTYKLVSSKVKKEN